MRPTTECVWDQIIWLTRSVSLITLASSALKTSLLLRMAVFRCWRSPRDSTSGWGRDLTAQPFARVQVSNTQRPPRLHTAPQEGFIQQDSQHRAPKWSTASGCQPRPMTLLQWIPRTPPVTVHMLPETPERGTDEAQMKVDKEKLELRGRIEKNN